MRTSGPTSYTSSSSSEVPLRSERASISGGPAGGGQRRRLRLSVGLFLATALSVYATYGWFWSGGDPFGDLETARDSARFAAALMSILLAHELGHYIVGRRHGLKMSPPYFIPAPVVAFGTFGAIIQMKDRPRSRSGLLEMGAAGPRAGAAVTLVVLALGLPGTLSEPPVVSPPPSPAEVDLAPWLVAALDSLDAALSWGPIGAVLETLAPPVPEGHAPVLIMNNPLVMDLLGRLILGAPPGRFDQLSPVAMAGWVGCLLTAINLVPIGQLDGGHVLNALAPSRARQVSIALLVLALVGGIFWTGWIFWGALLLAMGAWRSVPIPERPGLSPRARLVAAAVLLTFVLTFMPRPIEMDSLPYTQVTEVP